jgi:hypothetical protein
MHIMKTAGFTTARHLANALPDASIWGLSPNDAVWFSRVYRYINPRPLARCSPAELASFSMFCGHFPFAARELMGERVEVATVVRKPVDRVVSFLKHCQREHPEHLDRPLEEIYEDEWFASRFTRNHVTKLFAMSTDEMLANAPIAGWRPSQLELLARYREDESSLTDADLGVVFRNLAPGGRARDMYELIGAPNTALVEVDDSRLADAIDRLQHVTVLGLYEQYAAFVGALNQRLATSMRSDVAVNVGAAGEASAALRRRIAADNQADIELYQAAVRTCAARGLGSG